MSFREYWFKEARWYEFWLPQSGLAGGIVFVVLGIVAVALMVNLFGGT